MNILFCFQFTGKPNDNRGRSLYHPVGRIV